MTPNNNERNISDIKKKIIISMCAIILLVLTLFGITYAYFTTKVQGNKNETSIEISAAMLKLEYNGEKSYIEVEGLQPGEKIESKIFSVKNTGTRTIENYDVILENVVNELNRYEDLTYELKCTSSDGKVCNGNSGTFPRMNQVIATNTIDSNVKHFYELTLTYKDTYTNQSVDMNKEISAKVNIKDDYSDIKTFKIYGNYTVIESPINNSTRAIEYLGNYDGTDKYIVPINVNNNMINISLNEPLRKLGDVADYIDLENRIVVRRVGEKIFDGGENILTYEEGVYVKLLHNYNIPAISNYYSNNIEDEIHFTSTKNSNAIHFRVNETADEFKNLLEVNYNNNQPLKVLYALQDETYETINVPEFIINNTNTITVCDNNSLCASNIEVEFDE